MCLLCVLCGASSSFDEGLMNGTLMDEALMDRLPMKWDLDEWDSDAMGF